MTPRHRSSEPRWRASNCSLGQRATLVAPTPTPTPDADADGAHDTDADADGAHVQRSAASSPPPATGVRLRWVAGYLVLLITLSLLAFALVREARHTGEFSRGGKPGIFTGICVTDIKDRFFTQVIDTHCYGAVYDAATGKHLGEASLHSFVRVGARDVLRVRVVDAHDQFHLVVRPDSAIDTLAYLILICTDGAVALGFSIALVLELRRSPRRGRVGKILFRGAVAGLGAILIGSQTLHLPTAATGLAPVTDPVLDEQGAIEKDLRVITQPAAHYYRVLGHAPDSPEVCGDVPGCAHGSAFVVVDGAGDLVGAGWRLRLTDRGRTDAAINAVAAGHHPAVPRVSAAAIHPYPAPRYQAPAVVALPGAPASGPNTHPRDPFRAGPNSYWTAQREAIFSTDADEIIVMAITRSDGNRLALDARASAVLHDVRTIFDNIH